MGNQMKKNVLILLCASFFLSCTSQPSREAILTQSKALGFVHTVIETPGFNLASWVKITQLGAPIVVYIEGDGHSVNRFGLATNDPTPMQPLAFSLAQVDPRSNVAYLARPCQYHPQSRDCPVRYWTSHRFSPEVIASTGHALKALMQKAHTKHLHLVGFSGGGGIAALTAANMKVDSLITVAGDLNLDIMQQHHKTKTQDGSLNPLNIAHQLQKTPQIHWVGLKDTVVPQTVAQSFVQIQSSHCVRLKTQNFDHHKGWLKAWPQLVLEKPYCSDQ